MSPLDLHEIRATSPTLAEAMRACLLRAGLSRATGGSELVLENPKAWLGTAYHGVIEKIVAVDLGQEILDAAGERLWSVAIATQQQRADVHALDRRVGSPTAWFGYHVARASVVLRAQDLSLRPVPAVEPDATQASGPRLGGSIREQEFIACGGKLLGRPDVIRAGEVVDFKSGAIVEYDDKAQTEVVKVAYIRQLRIYGFLLKETLGWWPLRGLFLPLVGIGVEVALEPSECAREATEAVALLDAYNGKVRAGAAPAEFASHSPQGCRRCPYKLLCPAFWQMASREWAGQLDGAAVEGVLAEALSPIHAVAARAVALDIQAGSEMRRRAQSAPLNPTTHPGFITLAAGERFRLVGLRARPDSVLAPIGTAVLRHLGEAEQVAAVYARATLCAGDCIAGPAIVREPLSTTHIGRGQTGRVGPLGEIIIEARGEEQA